MLQEEIDDREGFNTEAVQTVDWLTETKTELQQLGPTMEAPEVTEKIEKIKVKNRDLVCTIPDKRYNQKYLLCHFCTPSYAVNIH